MADQHPTHAEPEPPFPEQEQEPPGREDAMRPLADHGEETYVGHGRLKDKVALITGGDSGIGRAVAIAFAREGADVLCSYLEEHDDAAETKRWVEEAGRRCVTVSGDIGQRDHCFALVDHTEASQYVSGEVIGAPGGKPLHQWRGSRGRSVVGRLCGVVAGTP
jgi:NAD(P)-dependent dehydrogenase (short-subunit alcohol dehydrogenase family)